MCLRVAYLTGSQCSNWGSLASTPAAKPEAWLQEAIQAPCWCEVADESVVVSKARPMKASNGVEVKTGPTVGNESIRADHTQKVLFAAKGRRLL